VPEPELPEPYQFFYPEAESSYRENVVDPNPASTPDQNFDAALYTLALALRYSKPEV
jgi:hypothetical protein